MRRNGRYGGRRSKVPNRLEEVMGQYHYTVNLDKREFLHPHKLGDGLKLMEFGNSAGGTMTGLAILLACSNGRGGGDLHTESPLIGSWAGDRIAIIGDYAEPDDFPGFEDDSPWSEDHADSWTDISVAVRELIEADGIFAFENLERGWVTRVEKF
jgi:hypothetical protein